jgi:hypothetical protein
MAIQVAEDRWQCTVCQRVTHTKDDANACEIKHNLTYIGASRNDWAKIYTIIMSSEHQWDLLGSNNRVVKELKKIVGKLPPQDRY